MDELYSPKEIVDKLSACIAYETDAKFVFDDNKQNFYISFETAEEAVRIKNQLINASIIRNPNDVIPNQISVHIDNVDVDELGLYLTEVLKKTPKSLADKINEINIPALEGKKVTYNDSAIFFPIKKGDEDKRDKLESQLRHIGVINIPASRLGSSKAIAINYHPPLGMKEYNYSISKHFINTDALMSLTEETAKQKRLQLPVIQI